MLKQSQCLLHVPLWRFSLPDLCPSFIQVREPRNPRHVEESEIEAMVKLICNGRGLYRLIW
jgi:hypothetical protein